eukprot:8693976-Pyramimonas_sp.AAC.1
MKACAARSPRRPKPSRRDAGSDSSRRRLPDLETRAAHAQGARRTCPLPRSASVCWSETMLGLL